MKNKKKIYLIALVIVLTFTIGLVAYAESNTSDEDKEETSFLKRVTTKAYWHHGLKFLEKGIRDGAIDEETADSIKEYFKEKAENKVPLMQELVDQGLITSEQKDKIEEYLQGKKDDRMNPLDELVDQGIISSEDREKLEQLRDETFAQVRKASLMIIGRHLVEMEIVTKDELIAIHDYVKENEEVIADSEDDILTILLDEDLISQEQYDQIVELKNNFDPRRIAPNKRFIIKHSFGGMCR